MVPTQTKIKPYNSTVIKVQGIAKRPITFGQNSVPVEWHILSGSCEPILSRERAQQLGIIQFNAKPNMYQPIMIINKHLEDHDKSDIQTTLKDFPENFSGLGKLKHHQVKLHVDQNVKPVNVPQRPIPYHLRERAQKATDTMVKEPITSIEKHPENEPATWISRTAITPKSNGDIRVTLHARNVNKAVQSTNLLIPQ